MSKDVVITKGLEMMYTFLTDLTEVYRDVTGIEAKPLTQKNFQFFDIYEIFWMDSLLDNIKKKIKKKPHIFAKISDYAKDREVFRESGILLVYYYVDTVAIQTKQITPMEEEDLKLIYDDLGFSKTFADYESYWKQL